MMMMMPRRKRTFLLWQRKYKCKSSKGSKGKKQQKQLKKTTQLTKQQTRHKQKKNKRLSCLKELLTEKLFTSNQASLQIWKSISLWRNLEWIPGCSRCLLSVAQSTAGETLTAPSGPPPGCYTKYLSIWLPTSWLVSEQRKENGSVPNVLFHQSLK